MTTIQTTASDPLAFYRYLHVPAEAGDETLLALFHGTGGDAESFLGLGRAVSETAALLALDGDVSEGGMRRFFRRRAEGVYDMADLAERTARLDSFLEAALAKHAPDPARVVGIGYSNGANILANLAFESPDRVRRMILMHPLIPFEPPAADLSSLSVLITAGRRDPICPPQLTEALAQALKSRGATVTLEWRPGGHELDMGEVEAARRFRTETS